MDEAGHLLDVAAAIADGAPVDWEAVETGQDDDNRLMAARLQVLERLVRGHDTLRSLDGASGTPTATLTLLSEAEAAAGGRTGPLQVRWGPLVVLDKVGRGSFGDVYRAWDPRVDREVALKLMPDRGADERSAAIEEARRLARVDHPNVLTVYGAERIDGRIGMWTKFVRGGTLEDEIRERGPLTVDEAARVGIDVARALGAVHAAGLLHRDVKAHNVMRDASGAALLSDFGTSVEFDEQTGIADPRIAGTPLYLAPEVLTGQPASVASDLYSLGVLLFHAVTGAYPVRGATLREIRRAHEAGERTALGRERPELPAPIVRIVERLLAADPADRFADAPAVEAALLALSRPREAHVVPRRIVALLASLSALAVALSLWTWANSGRFGWRSR